MFGVNNNNDPNNSVPLPANMPAAAPAMPSMPNSNMSAGPMSMPPAPDPMAPMPPAPSMPAADPTMSPNVLESNHFPPTEPPVMASAPDAPSAPALPSATPADVPANDLMQLKQQALQSLTPLVGQLEQTPEEKFKTTMMMLQASDNQELVKDAYVAANAITDEKARAHALLDVVNEINYFTHQNEGSTEAPAN